MAVLTQGGHWESEGHFLDLRTGRDRQATPEVEPDQPVPVSAMAVAALRAWVASVTVPGRDPFLELEPPLQEGGQGQRLDPTWGREGEEGCEGGGSLEGAVSLVWREGDSFQGRYERGRRHGWGVVSGRNHILLHHIKLDLASNLYWILFKQF